MRILQVGNFSRPWCSEEHWRLTLESLGHEVRPVQENEVLAEEWPRLAREHRADLTVWTRTPNFARGDTAVAVREMPCPTVAYHLDLYAPIERKGNVYTDTWWRSKYVLTPDGGSDEFWKQAGINHLYMPPAVYHGACYRAESDPKQACDVLFVGSYDYHRDWPYRRRLIDWLRATYGDRFKLVPGPGHAAIREAPLNVLYASAKVVVGDSFVPGFSHYGYTSDRLFETIGRGGFLVYPRIAGVTDGTLVREGEHLACYDFGDFDGPAGLKRTIDFYLENGDARENVRGAGHEHVKASHTYRDRWRAALSVVAAAEGWPLERVA